MCASASPEIGQRSNSFHNLCALTFFSASPHSLLGVIVLASFTINVTNFFPFQCVWMEGEERGVEGRGWGWFNGHCLDVF